MQSFFIMLSIVLSFGQKSELTFDFNLLV
uniref:Uncharacterized protein n=1 Tax=Arundo donax TaxID=35708 RepID=A0A0A9BZ03_ARUDO